MIINPRRHLVTAFPMLALVLGLLTLAGPTTAAAPGGAMPSGLTVEQRTSPADVDDLTGPILGWHVPSERQSAYQVEVATSRSRLASGRLVWDSGRVASAASANVPYAGPVLDAGEGYEWRVRTWSGDGKASPWSHPAHFGTALGSDWGDSRPVWLGRAGLARLARLHARDDVRDHHAERDDRLQRPGRRQLPDVAVPRRRRQPARAAPAAQRHVHPAQGRPARGEPAARHRLPGPDRGVRLDRAHLPRRHPGRHHRGRPLQHRQHRLPHRRQRAQHVGRPHRERRRRHGALRQRLRGTEHRLPLRDGRQRTIVGRHRPELRLRHRQHGLGVPARRVRDRARQGDRVGDRLRHRLVTRARPAVRLQALAQRPVRRPRPDPLDQHRDALRRVRRHRPGP